jgi:hypothetical protein
VLTLVGGKAVYGNADFKDLAPLLPQAMPGWSPVRTFGGYQKRAGRRPAAQIRLRGNLRMQHRLRRARARGCMGIERADRRPLLLGRAGPLVLGGVT